ncbi:glycosyltransferase family 4 protein [Rhizobium sp. RCAM05973]|uniref:glycosyltransferase family 4 protein n=1 Tax=Rhizobium sp. RCAM05973 TaxID=2994066 RepID=UPI0022EBBFD0|nr:glycosyltransferase family 4 protein [Rhizobium sp. RCAM05973]
MDKIKVLYVSPVSFFKGGAERSLFDLLSNEKISPYLAVPAEGELAVKARAMGIPVTVVTLGSVEKIRRPFTFSSAVLAMSDAWKAGRQLRAFCAENSIGILHTNGLKAHSVAALARLGSPLKVVMHFRDIAYTWQEKLVWRLQTLLAARAVFVSGACCPFPSLPKNGRVIPNGVDPKPPVELKVADTVRIGFIGRIHPHKGLHTLLDWVKLAHDRGTPVRLIVRGTFSTELPGYESEIKSKVEALDLNDIVEFQGFINDPNGVYKDLDVVCAPAQAPEPFARTILEPMNMGLPVIATPTGGTTEMVIHNVTGFLVQAADDFCAAVSKIHLDAAGTVKVAEEARNHVRTHFSKERLHSSVHSLYSELTANAA